MTNALFFALLFLPSVTVAQRVSNVLAEQEGQELVIGYALESDAPVEVVLFVSTDEGKNWQGPLSNCSGDVGKNVSAGVAKRIRWAVLEEREFVGDGIRFKVVARGALMKLWLNSELKHGSMTDIDGNVYATIQIGNQVWMAENLRTTRYRNGDDIPNVSDKNPWSGLTTGAWAHYANDNAYETPYGKLYNWYAVTDPRKVCPAGWHIPRDEEWTTLTGYLGGESVAGGKLISTMLWKAPNSDATNSSGFSGLPGGYRGNSSGKFNGLGGNGYWWSASESGAAAAWDRYLKANSAGVDRFYNDKSYGFSLRCIRD